MERAALREQDGLQIRRFAYDEAPVITKTARLNQLGDRLVWPKAPSRAHDAARRAPTDYKNVMTKSVLSLPHLLRGEELTSVPWESEAILSWGRRRLGPSVPTPCARYPPARRASLGFGGASWKLPSGRSGLPQPCLHGAPGRASQHPSGARAPPANLCHRPICVSLPGFPTWRVSV